MKIVCSKRSDSDIWHFCVNCLDWPTADYAEKWVEEIRVTGANICIKCQTREQERKCLTCDPHSLYNLKLAETSQEVTNGTIRHSGSYLAAGDIAAYSIEDDEILTASQVSKLLKLHQKTIYKLAEQDKIPGRQVGKVWRFLKSEIMKQFQKRDV